jgi:drug/metabolite transporter (DMT)-like permease
MTNFFGLASVTLMLAVGQALFKQVGVSIRGVPIHEALLVVLRQPLFYVSLLIYGCATLLWIWILSRVPLSQAYPWVALTIFLVAIFGWCFFGERPSPAFWFGLVLVMIGVVITQYSSGSR